MNFEAKPSPEELEKQVKDLVVELHKTAKAKDARIRRLHLAMDSAIQLTKNDSIKKIITNGQREALEDETEIMAGKLEWYL